MAIYCFKCSNEECGKQFEKIESFNQSETEHNCPSCDSKAEKKLSSSSVVFSGEGWTPKFYNRD